MSEHVFSKFSSLKCMICEASALSLLVNIVYMCMFVCVQSICLALQRQQTENNTLLKEGRELRAAADRVQVRSFTEIFISSAGFLSHETILLWIYCMFHSNQTKPGEVD